MSDTPKLTITFNQDETINMSLDKDINANKLLSGLTDVLIQCVKHTAPNPRDHNRAITVITQKLERQKKEETQ